MKQKLTERQEGLKALRDLLYKYNAVLVGDKGVRNAYAKFMKRNKLEPEPPTQSQLDYCKLLDQSLPSDKEIKKV